MNESNRWIVLEGAVNVRDLGGLPTADGGVTAFGRVLRSDNLQALTPSDIGLLVGDLKLRRVVDLRSHAEVTLEGPGPLAEVPEVSIHHHTLFAEGGIRTDAAADTAPDADVIADAVLPWTRRTEAEIAARVADGFYYGYLRDRPDSVLAALRAMARDDGAAIVHCAAGKDRTGVLCALALEVAGVTREAIIADYVATGERMPQILARLRGSETYRDDVDSVPTDHHIPRSEYLTRFLDVLDRRHGGPLAWLADHGWTAADDDALRGRLLG
jgi:protein tyrosine/serine phosphatase